MRVKNLGWPSLSNIHPISETEESIFFSDRMLVECIYIFLPHEGTHEDEEWWLWKVEIRDELIDDLELVSRRDVDRCLEMNHWSWIMAHWSMNPIILSHILSQSIPVLLSIFAQSVLDISMETTPERRKGFEGAADSRSDSYEPLSMLLVWSDPLEEIELDLDRLTMDLIVANIGNIDPLECADPDMKRDVFLGILDTIEECIREV